MDGLPATSYTTLVLFIFRNSPQLHHNANTRENQQQKSQRMRSSGAAAITLLLFCSATAK
jgi:hypothetical protein